MAQNIPTTQLAETISAQWGLSLRVCGCSRCGQVFLINEDLKDESCPYCFRGQLDAQPGNVRIEPPELIVPYAIKIEPSGKSTNSLNSILAGFSKGIWLKAKDFSVQNMLMRARKLFMPMWLVDCTLSGNWQADAGFDYQVESSLENYMAGEWKTNKVVETRIHWEHRLGLLNRTYNNTAVPAIRDHQALQKLVGSFIMANACPYDKNLIESSILRNPDLQTDESFPLAQSYLKQIASEDSRNAAGAQHVRNFSMDVTYESLNWTQLLLPYYSTYYIDDQGIPHVVWINGESGLIDGPRLASQTKGWIWAGISAGISLACFLLALGCFALTAIAPPLAIVGTVLVIIAVGSGLFSIVPAVYPWIWNRKQLDPRVHVKIDS